MARGPLTRGPPSQKEKKPKIPKSERVKRPKKPPHPDNIAPDRRQFGTKTATAAKWPAMFKRHLAIIETHIRTIDRVMQSMKANIDGMGPEERGLWERGEKGNWILACGMMQRARVVLKDAREAAAGVLPANNLKEKKSLGIMGSVAEQYTAAPRPANWQPEFDPDAIEAEDDSDSDSDSDGDSSSTSSSSEDEEEQEPADRPERTKFSTPPAETTAFKPLHLNKKRKLSPDGEESTEKTEVANPYFVVDTQPTPIPALLNGAAPAKKVKKKHITPTTEPTETKPKKRIRDEAEAGVSKKHKKDEHTPEAEIQANDQATVDFTAVERQLQAEVQAGLEAQALEEEKKRAKKEEKKEKKRKRISDGTVSAEVVSKKVKKDKEKQRIEGGENGVGEEGKKKKRKHKDEKE